MGLVAERCSIDDLWALLCWAEMHSEMRPYDEIDEPRISRARVFIKQEIVRRERRKARRRPAPVVAPSADPAQVDDTAAPLLDDGAATTGLPTNPGSDSPRAEGAE